MSDPDRSFSIPEPMKRERVALIVVSSLLVLVTGGLVWALFADRIRVLGDDTYSIAESLLGREEELQGAWPPVAEELGSALERHADAGLEEAPFDAAIDAGPPLPAPVDEAGYRVRQGSAEGLYYLEVVIGDADFDDPLPMLVMIHGRGGSAQIPGGPFLGLSHPVRVIVPQAPDRLGSGWEWLPVYVGQGLVDRLSSTLFQTANRLASMLRTVAAERPTVGKIIVSGFSQGGLLALTLGLYHDDLVGHAFPLSCWLPPPLEPPYRRGDLDYPRIRAMHGTSDTIIPITPTRALFDRLHERGFDVELVEFEGVAHTMSGEENELFHHWLDAAVCRTLGDDVCAVFAESDGLRLLGREVPDAGYPDDAPYIDADLDAGPIPEGGAPRAAPDAFDFVVPTDIEHAEPTEPIDVEHVEHVEPTEHVEPVEHVEPTEPTEHVEPTDVEVSEPMVTEPEAPSSPDAPVGG